MLFFNVWWYLVNMSVSEVHIYSKQLIITNYKLWGPLHKTAGGSDRPFDRPMGEWVLQDKDCAFREMSCWAQGYKRQSHYHSAGAPLSHLSVSNHPHYADLCLLVSFPSHPTVHTINSTSFSKCLPGTTYECSRPPFHATHDTHIHSCSKNANTRTHTQFWNPPRVSLTGCLSCSHSWPSVTDARLPDDSTAPAGAALWHYHHYCHSNEHGQRHIHTLVLVKQPLVVAWWNKGSTSRCWNI